MTSLNNVTHCIGQAAPRTAALESQLVTQFTTCLVHHLEYCRAAFAALQTSGELVELFGLGSEEELLERFACALLQTYHCSHNDFSPEQQVLYCRVLHPCLAACALVSQLDAKLNGQL